MPLGAIVYLLHAYDPEKRLPAYRRHYLGVALHENAINLQAIPHGRGLRQPIAGALPVYHIADIWHVPSLKVAYQLRARFRLQGSRAKWCGICRPHKRPRAWKDAPKVRVRKPRAPKASALFNRKAQTL